jgi:hypothetical protein
VFYYVSVLNVVSVVRGNDLPSASIAMLNTTLIHATFLI